jgi:hypothetical protein
MSRVACSGQSPFEFAYRPELHTLPSGALDYEIKLHGGFAIDPRPGAGQIFYGMPGFGMLRIDPDLRGQQLIELPDDLRPLNFHSTKIGMFDGKWRLFLPAEGAGKVAIVDLDGKLDFVLPRPEFEAYADASARFHPTDVALVGHHLYVADGYGSNYISSADVTTRKWTGIFGGKTEDPQEDGKFATAHGLNRVPDRDLLAIADRPSARIQIHGLDGGFHVSHHLPHGAWPCGINFIEYNGRSLAVVGSLNDPVEGRPAPIYVLDGETYEVLSTIRPKEELGVEAAQHLHNVIWHVQDGRLYLICQSWNPGYYFVLEAV